MDMQEFQDCCAAIAVLALLAVVFKALGLV